MIIDIYSPLDLLCVFSNQFIEIWSCTGIFFLIYRKIYQGEEGQELVQGEQLRLKGVARARQEEQKGGGESHWAL